MDGAGEVAADDSSCSPERIISVQAVDRIESYGVDLHEDFSRSRCWDVDGADEGGLFLGIEYESIHRGHFVHAKS